jgi:hypothetical protein
MEEEIRQIIFYKHYFPDFYSEQTIRVRKKIGYVYNLNTKQKNVP